MILKLLLSIAIVLHTTQAGFHILSEDKPAKESSQQLVTPKAKKLRAPLVKDKDCSELCIFKNDDNSWCFSTTPPIVTIGWEWNNTFNEHED